MSCPWAQGLYLSSVHDFHFVSELWCGCSCLPLHAAIPVPVHGPHTGTLTHGLASSFHTVPAWWSLDCVWCWLLSLELTLTCSLTSSPDLPYHQEWSGLLVDPGCHPQTWLLVLLMSCCTGPWLVSPALLVVLSSWIPHPVGNCWPLLIPDPWEVSMEGCLFRKTHLGVKYFLY